MNNDLTQKEKEIQDAFDGLSFDLDTSAIWDNIEPQLLPVEKNRKIIWWTMAGLFIGILSMAGYIYQDSMSTVALPAATESNQALSVPITSKISVKNEASSITPEITSETLTTNLNMTITEKYIDVIQSESSNLSISSSTILSSSTSSRLSTSLKSLESNSGSQTEYSSQSTIVPNSNSSFLFNSINDQKDFSNITAAKEGESRKLTNEVESIIRNVNIINYLDRIEISSLKEDQPTVSSPQIKPLKNTLWKPYFTVLSGVNVSNQKVSVLDNEGFDRSQFDRESGLLGSSSLFTYGKENQKGWRWNIGLSHNRLTSRYAYQGRSTIPSTITGIESYQIDTEGTLIGNQGTLDVNTVQSYDVIWHKSHDLVDINIGIGKELLRTGNLSISTDLSIGYNVWSQHQGYYFTGENEQINKFENGEESPYQNQGVSLGGRLQLAYDLNNISISLSPFSSYAMQNTTKSTNFYQIKNSHYGIQLGIVYRP